MKKMYKELMKQIYYGEFYPSEDIMSNDPEYKAKSLKIGDEFQYFMDILNSDEDKKRIDELHVLILDTYSMEKYDSFAYGFSAGLHIMNEANEVRKISDSMKRK